MNKKIFSPISALAATVLLSGCATVFSGSTQSIHVKTSDTEGNLLEGVTCMVIESNGGTNVVHGNPGSVIVTKGNGPLSIKCKKNGYNQLNTAVGDSFNATTLVNVLFWPGFIVDAATGSMKKYPSHYNVTMEKIKK